MHILYSYNMKAFAIIYNMRGLKLRCLRLMIVFLQALDCICIVFWEDFISEQLQLFTYISIFLYLDLS